MKFCHKRSLKVKFDIWYKSRDNQAIMSLGFNSYSNFHYESYQETRISSYPSVRYSNLPQVGIVGNVGLIDDGFSDFNGHHHHHNHFDDHHHHHHHHDHYPHHHHDHFPHHPHHIHISRSSSFDYWIFEN